MKNSFILFFLISSVLFSCEKEDPDVTAEFGVDFSSIEAGSTINFYDLSTGDVNSWFWIFEGGSPIESDIQNPSVVYNTPGIYNVSLMASNPTKQNTINKEEYIKVYDVLTAEFSADNTIQKKGGIIQYTDASVGGATSWDWYFEGGTPETSTLQNPVVVYDEAGTFDVKLTSSNIFTSASSTENIEHKEDYIIIYNPIMANFSADNVKLNAGSTVEFTDNSSGDVISWQWYFEGGNPEISSDQNPVITYEEEGEYDVRLISSSLYTSDTVMMESYINILDLNRGLVAYFPFNGNANDESEMAINGNIVGAIFTQDRFGNENSALSFDGEGDWVTCGTDNRGVSNLITISLWVKSSDLNGIILSKYNIINANPGYILFINKDGHPGFSGRDGKWGDYITTPFPDSKINDSEWHHILATINNDKWELMVDGLLVGEALSWSLSPYLTNDIELTIGHIINDTNVPRREIEGLIDDVAIYNRILSLKEKEFIRLYGL